MRSAILAIVTSGLAGCAARVAAPARPATATAGPAGSPASDLAAGKPRVATDPGAPPHARDPRVTDLDTIRIRAEPHGIGGEPELTSVATAGLFQRATAFAKDGESELALGIYRSLVDEFPDSLYAPTAMFDIAAIYDTRGDSDHTIAALRDLVRVYPQSHEAVEGELYISALQAEHQQWADAHTTLTDALSRGTLTWSDRLEALARDGYTELEQGHEDAADAQLTAAVAAWRNAPRIDDTYYIAMAQYYLGELAHRRFVAQPVRLPDDQMYRDLDAKRVLAVAAYGHWKDSLGFRQAYWATAAGYEMSQVFVEMWRATVTAPYPHAMDPRERDLYIADVHHKVHGDLQKALDGHRMNVELARAFGAETVWSKASERAALEVADLLAADSDGHYVTPD